MHRESQMTKDGISLRKKVMKRDTLKQDKNVYIDPIQTLKLLGKDTNPKDHKLFIDTIEKNQIYDMSIFYGYD